MPSRVGSVVRGAPCAVLGALLVVALAAPAGASAQGPADTGVFSAPFTEPSINGTRTDENCIEHTDDHPHGEYGEGHDVDCKPAAGSLAILAGGGILYWNALEGTEDVDNTIALELGNVLLNDQVRLLDLNGGDPRWRKTRADDGGANPDGYDTDPVVPGTGSTETYNDGALFCSDLNFLANGRLLAAGGTAYYSDGSVPGTPYGAAELEGLRNARIYDPQTNSWTQTQDMNFGRWYPTLVTLGDGKQFVASGVQKLTRPIYKDRPADSGRNIVQTETFDPATGEWTYNGASADRSLPLFARLHLLPNGHVYYNTGGQVFNPFGQAYDEVTWNVAASYDPVAKAWSDLGVPGLGTPHPGFRGSSFSVMLPLAPDVDGTYTQARFLSAGGVLGTSPGSYVATAFSAVTTVDTADGDSISTRATGALAEPRWYSSAVLLPTGEVAAFNGADRDEVVAPGTGFPSNRAELFDPESETWRPVAESKQLRTYHNTAALLPDGRVLVGGHAPIPTLYGSHTTLPGGFSPNDGRDPSFEIFSPPYLFYGPRPKIMRADAILGYGGRTTIMVDRPASEISSVVLVRNASITHLVDGDQRSVELDVVARRGKTVRVALPPDGNVAPPGPYMLFVNRSDDQGLIPSVARQVFVRPRVD